MDPHHSRNIDIIAARREIERWLATQLGTAAGQPALFADQLDVNFPRAERLRLIEKVLEGNPALRSAARRLSIADQLRINLVVLGERAASSRALPIATCGIFSVRSATRCSARHRGRPR